MRYLIQDVVSVFTRGTRHLNRLVFVRAQNVVYHDLVMRTISSTTYNFLIWIPPSDKLQIGYLSREIFARCSRLFTLARQIATTRQYGYMFLDFRSTTPPVLRVRTCGLKSVPTATHEQFPFRREQRSC